MEPLEAGCLLAALKIGELDFDIPDFDSLGFGTSGFAVGIAALGFASWAAAFPKLAGEMSRNEAHRGCSRIGVERAAHHIAAEWAHRAAQVCRDQALAYSAVELGQRRAVNKYKHSPVPLAGLG